jgi:cyanophycinase
VLVQLIGGGWRPEAGPRMYGPFLDAAGAAPDVACVVVDEGDGIQQFGRWRDALASVARCRPGPVLVPRGSPLSLSDLDGADALLVCGGLTPAYAGALAPVAEQVRAWLAAGNRPYAGFSAGAAVGAAAAVVGGWLQDGTPVCPEDAAEDLEEPGPAPLTDLQEQAARAGGRLRAVAADVTAPAEVDSAFAPEEADLGR